MANPAVEKLKVLGLRHGEKAGVALFAALCIVCMAKAATHPTIDTTPDQLKKAAEAANQNLDRPQKDEDILKNLEAQNVKLQDFEKVVDNRMSTKQDATQFALDNSWVSPEPGAGLLREMPTLIAVRELYAHSGRGGLVLVKRNDAGELVYVKEPDTPKGGRHKKKPKYKPSAGGSMMGGAGTKKKKRRSGLAAKQAEIKLAEKKNEKLQAGLSGKAEDAPKDAEEEAPEGTLEEITQGHRWVVLTGVLDHKQLRENYAKALKIDFASAAPHYLGLEAERQTMNTDGSWPEAWEKVDRDPSEKILDDAAEIEEELVPKEAILEALVDDLPFLRGNYYRGVHVAELVPAKDRKIDIPKPKSGGAKPGGSSMSGGDYMSQMNEMANSAKAGERGGMFGGTGPSSGSMMSMNMNSMRGGGGKVGAGAGPEDGDVEKTEAPKIMVRMLDYTVEPGQIYRYRIQIVVRNPNLGSELVAPGTDNKEEEKFGPWSEPSGPVGVPADVSAYAMGTTPDTPADPRDKVKFQVVRFHPEDGLTIVKYFDAGPGQIVGEPASAAIPKFGTEKTTSQTKMIDFVSRQIVIDTVGGREPLVALNLNGPALEDPARSLVMRPDGTLVLHDEARDTLDGEMAEMKSVYEEIMELVKDNKGKKRRSESMSMGPGASRGMNNRSGF